MEHAQEAPPKKGVVIAPTPEAGGWDDEDDPLAEELDEDDIPEEF